MDNNRFYYTTQIAHQKFYHNWYVEKKNNSDVNVQYLFKKKNKLFKKIFKTKFLSKNLLILNIQKNSLNSEDIYIMIITLIPRVVYLGIISIISFSNLFTPKNTTKKKYHTNTFGLIESDTIKFSKKVIKNFDIAELIHINFFFEIRFIPKLHKFNFILIERTSNFPLNYYPRFLVKKKNCTIICEKKDMFKVKFYKKSKFFLKIHNKKKAQVIGLTMKVFFQHDFLVKNVTRFPIQLVLKFFVKNLDKS